MTVSRRRLLRDLKQLVRIPSWQDCEEIADYALGVLRDDGLDARRDPAGNVIAEVGSGGPGLLLNAHLDTVPPGDFCGDPFAARIEDGKLVGRGASDDKAGVAVVLEIARHLLRRPPGQRVVLALTLWEESTAHGPNGSYQAARDAGVARGIVLESTMSESGRTMGVNIGCKGIARLDMTVHGTACHAGAPERGDNAIHRAAEVIAAFGEEFDTAAMPRKTYQAGGRDIDLGVLATLTEIEATQGVNVVPGRCRLTANCRLLPDGDLSPIHERARRLADRLGPGRLSWSADRWIPGHLCEDAGLVAACRKAVRETGLRSTVDIMNGRADSTIFQHEGGIQTVVMGPGTIGTAHTCDEYVKVDSLATGAEAILRAVERLVGE